MTDTERQDFWQMLTVAHRQARRHDGEVETKRFRQGYRDALLDLWAKFTGQPPTDTYAELEESYLARMGG